MNRPDAEGRTAVEVGGRVVPVSNLDRVLWPAIGFTKRDLVAYYLRVADLLLPHLVNRPATLHRFPEGVTGKDFYQTRCPPHPAWLRTQPMHVFTSAKDVEAAVIDDVPALVWATNLSTVEFHPYLAPADRLDAPTALVFDLDPGPPAGLLEAARLALAIRDLLERHALATFVKTSGGKGLHLHVPLTAGQRYDRVKAFARHLARTLTARYPEHVTDVMTTRRRVGKVFIDWSQNDAGKSTVAAYSLRGLTVPTVATPLRWEEVERAIADEDRSALVFTFADVLDRIEAIPDPFGAMGEVHQRLPDTPIGSSTRLT